MSAGPSSSVMSEEVARFDALGDAWWDLDGPMAPLHRLNPVRIGWARDLILRHFKRPAPVGAPLAGVGLHKCCLHVAYTADLGLAKNRVST